MLDVIFQIAVTLFPLVFAAFAAFAIWAARREWPGLDRGERAATVAFVIPLAAFALASILTVFIVS